MRKVAASVLLAGSLLLAPGLSGAEEKVTAADVLKGTEINGFVSAGYNYNWNEPFDRGIDWRSFNDKHDSFSLELAQLVFHNGASEVGEAGYKLDLNFGYIVPKAIHSAGASSSDDLDVRQAYISYMAPVGSGLRVDVGKFVTEMGIEVIEGYEDWNWNYSRSFLFFYTIPFTHTGVRAVYSVNDKLALTGAIVNGWDNVTDNNGSKTVMLHAAVAPVEGTTVNVKYCVGAEQDDQNSNLRHVVNVNLSTSVGKLLLKADYVYGSEENVAGLGDSTWSGLAGYARYALSDKLSLNARAEVFYDDDGARTGTAQDMWELTLTPEYAVSDNLLVRGEYRHDASNKSTFDKNGSTSKNQDTLGVNVIYHF